jgi:hypothetical protein
MENKDNSERIERFLREQMSPEENEAFLNDLKNDKDLREEAQMMALMIKEMKEEQARQSEKLTENVLKNVRPAAAKIISIVRWSLSIAAMLLLVFGAVTLWNKQNDTDVLYAQADNIFEQHYSPYTLEGDSRGNDSDVERKLSELFNQVGTEKDISPVIEKLQKIYDSVDSEYEYSLYADAITRYLALAYLKDHNIDKAKELLKPLADNGDEDAIKLFNAIASLGE